MSEQHTACPYCGAEWPAELEMRFCGECGSNLGALSPEITEKERRTLTVVFADLSGFTSFSEQRDPEEVERVVNDLLAELGAAVESYGGYVDKYLGDAVMAVFGAPTAHEDDPFRAVRAGLEMLDVVDAFNEERGESLSVSVGINTGEVLWSKVGGGDFTVTGDAVNVAKRLESVADAGTVLVSDAVRRRTEGGVRVTPADAVAVEGREDPVQSHHAVALASGNGTTAGEKGGRAPLVGREEELDALLAQHDAPEPATLAVTGPAGIGKSRLLDAFAERLGDRPGPVDIQIGHCSQHADAPLEPFGDVLLASAGTGRGEPDAGRAVVRTLRDELAVDDPTRREVIANLLATSVGLEVPEAAVTDLPPERLHEEVTMAWATWLRERARDHQVVLGFEDLQWADEATLELFGALRERLTGTDGVGGEVTLAATLRPSGRVPDGFETLELSSLTVADVRAVTESVLGGAVTDGVADSLHDQAGGNPYFLVELLRYLRENDLFEETSAGYVLADEEQRRVPETLDGLLVGRIDALDPGARETLKGASVVGRRFWVDLLADVLDRDTHDPVEALSEREMVHRREESALPEDREYALEHALLRDAAYELLPKATRRELHGTLATELGQLCEGESAPLAGRVAHHAERAGEYETAIEWYRRAGVNAGEGYAQADAIEQFDRALALAREHGDAVTVAALQADLADVYETIGNLERARETVREGLDAAPEDSRVACRLLGIQATTRTEQGEFEAAAEAARRQREVATEVGAREYEVAAVQQRGLIAKNQGAFDEARDHLTEALRVAEKLESERIEADVRQDLGVVADLQGEYDRARSHLTAALEIARRHDARQLQAGCLNSLGIVAARQGEYDRARERWHSCLETHREIGDRQSEADTLTNLGLAARHQSEYDRAREHWNRSLEIYRQLGDRKGEADLLNNLGLLARDRGEYDRARERWDRSLAMYRDVGDRKGVAESSINLGQVCCRQGEYEQARDHLREGLDIARDIGDRLRETWSLYRLGELATRLGEYEQAREHAAASLEVARELGNPKERIQALLVLGVAANGCGDLDRAREQLDEALQVREEDVEPLPLAQVRLERARLALSRGEVEAAREGVERAQATVRELEASYWVGRCRALQGEIAVTSGSAAAAREHWRDALDRFEEVGAPDDALATLQRLADACREQGDDEQAREWHRQAQESLADAPEPVVDRHREWVETEP